MILLVKCSFNAIIFNAFKDAVDAIDEKGIEVNFGVYKDHLTRINRLALINVAVDDETTEEAVEAADTDDEESYIEQTESAE